jgi:hypothetical protein
MPIKMTERIKLGVEHFPAWPAPASGTYRLINIFGAKTSITAYVTEHQPLPGASVGEAWRLQVEDWAATAALIEGEGRMGAEAGEPRRPLAVCLAQGSTKHPEM